MAYTFDFENEELIEGDIAIPYEKNPCSMWRNDRVGYFKNALMKFGRMMDADYYAKPPDATVAGYHYLNAASLPRPISDIREESRRIFQQWMDGKLTEERKREILENARCEAATLVNLHDERGVVLCRNASEGLSYFLWLSGIMEATEDWPLVLTTDVENPSIQREIFIIKDHSNVDRKDSITTYPEFASQRPSRYVMPAPRPTGLRWGHFNVSRSTEEQSLEHLEDFIESENPQVLIISHVLRTTGRVLPVEKWIRKAREWKRLYHPKNPDLFVCVDGAQALGNVDIDFHALDCDMYIGCGQKALQGETIGLLYINPENSRIRDGLDRVRKIQPDTQVILRGMFHDDLEVQPNVDDDISYADIAGFTANVQRLKVAGLIEGNDMSQLSRKRLALKERCRAGLQEIAKETGFNISILNEEDGTSFILAFRIGLDPFQANGGWNRGFGSNPEEIFEPGAMHSQVLPTESWGKSIAEKLDRKNVGIAFLRRGNIFRLSFSDQSTSEDVYAFLAEFSLVLKEIKETTSKE